METIKLKDGEYYSKEEALVEIVETKEPEVITITTTKQNILDTIAMLEQRKAEAIAKFDAEIAVNQARLDQISVEVEKAIIVEKPIFNPLAEEIIK